MPSKSSASKKRRPRGQNILDLVPVRSPDFRFRILERPRREAGPREPGAAGTVSIAVPRFSGNFGQQVLRLARWNPEFNLNLDAYGSFVWLLIDGKTSVRELGLMLKEEYGDKVEPLYGRLAIFLSLLERNRLLTYANLPPRTEKPGRRRIR